jgi:hypothetical protein
MPSVVGLLEENELAARFRVEGLREEADRVQAELAAAAAAAEWQEWVIARRRVDAVLASDADSRAVTDGSDGAADARPVAGESAKPKTQVAVWRPGMALPVLLVDYQRIVQALMDRARLGQGASTCQEMAAVFRMDVVPARVEALGSKAKRLVARGWLTEPSPGQFILAAALSAPGGGS